jgi:uncharacterized membrane protein
MFKNQPKIDVKPTKSDKKWIFAGWAVCLLNIVLVAVSYFNLPDTIPIHFNFKGEAGGFGAKSTIWVLPVLGLLMYYGMNFIANKVKPHLMNYPVEVTEENASQLYSMSIKLLVLLNFLIAVIFVILTIEIIGIAFKWSQPRLSWLILVLIIFSTVLPFYFIYRMYTITKA